VARPARCAERAADVALRCERAQQPPGRRVGYLEAASEHRARDRALLREDLEGSDRSLDGVGDPLMQRALLVVRARGFREQRGSPGRASEPEQAAGAVHDRLRDELLEHGFGLHAVADLHADLLI